MEFSGRKISVNVEYAIEGSKTLTLLIEMTDNIAAGEREHLALRAEFLASLHLAIALSV